MRAEFEARVRPDRVFSPQRLAWDYWYIEGQYSYLRTLARHFFSPHLYRSFLTALEQWGEKHLGCGKCSELWISYYLDGCRQELHADINQGPWSIVFSLTRWQQRGFSGGETVTLQDWVLDYWRHLDPAQPLEHKQLLRRIPPQFNQLTVFDSRIPHGVMTVEGTRNPLDSRVVLHGWFEPPALRVEGTLSFADTEPVSDIVRRTWNEKSTKLGPLHGVLTMRLQIDEIGKVETVQPIATTLKSLGAEPVMIEAAIALATEVAGQARFPKSAGKTILLIPFISGEH